MTEAGDFLMSKYKKYMIWSAVMMVMSIVLTVHNVVESSEYKIGTLAEDACLFIIAVFFFSLNLKNERKMKDGDRKS